GVGGGGIGGSEEADRAERGAGGRDQEGLRGENRMANPNVKVESKQEVPIPKKRLAENVEAQIARLRGQVRGLQSNMQSHEVGDLKYAMNLALDSLESELSWQE